MMSERKKMAIPLNRKMAKYTPRYLLLSQPHSSLAHQLSQKSRNAFEPYSTENNNTTTGIVSFDPVALNRARYTALPTLPTARSSSAPISPFLGAGVGAAGLPSTEGARLPSMEGPRLPSMEGPRLPLLTPSPSSSFSMPCAAMSDAKFRPLLMSSSYVPISATRPSSTTTTQSARGRYCSAFVASTRVALRSTPSWLSTCSNSAWPTWLSTALRGSSIRYTSAAAYTARAMATRCFCPPESVTPRSPMMVASPPGRMSKSVWSCDALTQRAYFAAS